MAVLFFLSVTVTISLHHLTAGQRPPLHFSKLYGRLRCNSWFPAKPPPYLRAPLCGHFGPQFCRHMTFFHKYIYKNENKQGI